MHFYDVFWFFRVNIIILKSKLFDFVQQYVYIYQFREAVCKVWSLSPLLNSRLIININVIKNILCTFIAFYDSLSLVL